MEDLDRGEPQTEEKLRRSYRLLLVLGATCAALALALAYVLFAGVRRGASPDAVSLADPALRERALAQLVALSAGIWDTFPDPDVGRLMQPNLHDREAFGSPVSSNAFGWRERPVEVPKPPGTVRVVLLGDSFVFGPRIAAEDRIGPFLESYLGAHARRRPQRVEVVQIGMSSWNTRAESAYLRRNLSNLDPDLVVQIAVSNDLDDSGSTRGFGEVADFSSQYPRRTAMVYDFYPIWELGLGFRKASYLNAALSYEGRSRYVENARWFATLQRALAARGAGYLLVLDWADQPRTAAHYLAAELPPESVIFLSDSFRRDLRFRISDSDPHWQRAGNEQVARFLYGAIAERRMLEDLDLAAWPEAAAVFHEIDGQGRTESHPGEPLDLDVPAWDEVIAEAVDFRRLTEQTAPQIYGGVDKEGLVSPYASVLLARKGGGRVHIVGQALEAPELRGATVRIFADELPLGVVRLEPGSPVEQNYPLPAAVRSRPFFDVRFTADDWVYAGPNLRHCVVFRLERLETLE